MKYLFLSIILLFIILFSNCKKKNTDCECKNLGKGNGTSQGISFYNEVGLSIDFGCLNPVNENEIVYYSKDLKNEKYSIVKQNFLTNTKMILAEIKVIGQISWNKYGKIAFAADDYKIWVMDEDGTNLNKIDYNNFNLNPIWLNFGDTLIFQSSPDLSYKRTLVYNFQNLIIDSIPNLPIDFYSYISNNQLLYIENRVSKVVKKIDLSTIQITELVNIPTSNIVTGLAYLNNSIYISIANENIYKYNLQNSIMSKFQCGCIWKYYKSLNSNLYSKYLILIIVNTSTDDDIEYKYNSSLKVINIFDNTEIEIK